MRQAGDTATVVVVGGGIAGAFSAWFLVRAGATVTLLEPDDVGAHASGQNPGGLNPLYGPGIPGPLQAFALEAHALHLAGWDELSDRSGALGWRRKRRVNLAVDDQDVDRLTAMKARYDETDGFSARWLDRDELRALEPRLGDDVEGALDAEGDARVDASAYTTAVVEAARASGATIVRDRAIGIERAGSSATAVRTDAGPVPCDAVVIATGPWCAEPAGWLDVPLPMEPVKGDMLLLEPAGGGIAADLAWRDVAAYRTTSDAIWLGGSEDRTGYDAAPTEAARQAIVAGVARVLPVVADTAVRHQTAGLRPLTPDGLPIVGLAPGWENVGLALGGGRKGMLFGAAMGRAVADLLTTGTTTLSIDPCRPDRFVAA